MNDLRIRPRSMTSFTLHRTPEGTCETPDGVWVISHRRSTWLVLRRTAGPVLPMYKFRTLRDASHMLYRHLTRYTYRVGVGELCAVCGQPRPYQAPGSDLGWWWHTECRASTDPDGRDLALKEHP